MKTPITMRVLLAAVLATGMLWSEEARAGDGSRGLEVTVLGSYAEGDYGTGVATDTQALLLRLATGNQVQLRLDVPYLSSDAPADLVVRTGMGPMPRRRGAGGTDGTSGGPGMHGGPGGPGDGLTGGEATSTALTRESGIGDVRLAVSGRLLGGGVSLHRLAAELEVKAPTADEDENLGTGEWDYRFGLLGEYRFWSVTGFGGVGWNVLGDPPGVELRDVLDGWIGVESEPLGGRVLVSGWLEGNDAVVAGTDARAALGVGFRTTGRLRWRGALTAGLTDSAEDFSATFGVSMGVAAPSVGRRAVR